MRLGEMRLAKRVGTAREDENIEEEGEKAEEMERRKKVKR